MDQKSLKEIMRQVTQLLVDIVIKQIITIMTFLINWLEIIKQKMPYLEYD